MSGSHPDRGSKNDPWRMTGRAFQVRNVVRRFLCGSKRGGESEGGKGLQMTGSASHAMDVVCFMR